MAETNEQKRIRIKAKAKRLRQEAEKSKKPSAMNIMEDIALTAVSPSAGVSRMLEMGGKTPSEQQDIRESERMMRGEIAEGLTLGGAGEIGAGIAGIGGALTGEGFMPAFQESLAEREAKAKQFRQEAPVLSTVGQLAGALPTGVVAGTKLAATKLGQSIPKLSQVGLAGLESGLYGLLGQQGDIEERAKAGAVGLGTGLLFGTGSQAFPKVSEAAQSLIQKGIQPTVGQSFGAFTKSLEEGLGSLPLVRDVIKGGQYQVSRQFDDKVIEDAMKPIGFKVPAGKTAREVLAAANDAINDAYKKSVGKASLPNAKPLINKMGDIIKKNEDLVPEKFDQLRKKLEKAVSPSFFDENFKMSGKAVKKADEELTAEAASLSIGSPDDKQISRAIREFQRAFRDELVRQNPKAKDLANARQAYKNMIPIKKASVASPRSAGVFTPTQLITGMKQADTSPFKVRSGIGRMPQQPFAETAQEVMGSSIPDSGTPIRTLITGSGLKSLLGYGSVALGALPFYQTSAGRQLARGALASPRQAAGLLSLSPAVGGQVGIASTGE